MISFINSDEYFGFRQNPDPFFDLIQLLFKILPLCTNSQRIPTERQCIRFHDHFILTCINEKDVLMQVKWFKIVIKYFSATEIRFPVFRSLA